LDLSKIEIDILNLRTEGYVLCHNDIKRDINSICTQYRTEHQYVILSSTLYNKMWQNDIKMVYFKSDEEGHAKIIDIIYSIYVKNTIGKKESIEFLFNYDKDHRKNRDLVRILNKQGWYYSH